MFRASTCPSSGGQIVLSQHLVSSLSVNGCTVCRMRADCSPLWRLELEIGRGRHRYILYIVTDELQSASVAYSQRKIQLSGFAENPDSSSSQLIRMSGVVLYS